MKILVTNDDSIFSPGLLALVKLAQKHGEVFVVAPLKQQSGKSHAINIIDGLELQKIDLGLDIDAYSFNSTPADCVRAAHFGLKRDFDIVFSGINDGLNTGEDIAYSGTVAATTEAVLLGKKALAFSAFPSKYNDVVLAYDEIMEYISENKLLEINSFYNINVPSNDYQGIKITKQGNTHFNTIFELEDGLFFQRGHHQYHLDKDNQYSDVWATVNNYISITPLTVDRTNFEIYRKFLK